MFKVGDKVRVLNTVEHWAGLTGTIDEVAKDFYYEYTVLLQRPGDKYGLNPMGFNEDELEAMSCEGSRHSAHLYPSLGAHGICTVCSQIVPVYADGTAYSHEMEVNDGPSIP
jgi:hypothetical protein